MEIPYKKSVPDIAKDTTKDHHSFPPEQTVALEIERLSRLVFTPIEQAVTEIKRRREDTELIKKVHNYVGGDVPVYFNQTDPVFYLQRFIATPNYELMHAVDVVSPHNLPLIIGQDFKSKFSSNNDLKLPLGKLPVIKGLSHNEDEIIEYFTVIDFNQHNGKLLNEISTKLGVSLVDFHISLLEELKLPNVSCADETQWIDRNHRDDIYEQYKKVWALLCVHGIMIESYIPSDYSFFTQVVYPSFKEVEAELSMTPLVVENMTPEEIPVRNWNSYPSYFYQFIKRQFKD